MAGTNFGGCVLYFSCLHISVAAVTATKPVTTIALNKFSKHAITPTCFIKVSSNPPMDVD